MGRFLFCWGNVIVTDLELGYIFANVVAVGVALLGLRDRVEDCVRRLPAVGVVCQVLGGVSNAVWGNGCAVGELTQSIRFSAKNLSPLR